MRQEVISNEETEKYEIINNPFKVVRKRKTFTQGLQGQGYKDTQRGYNAGKK
jgi:hypothetical protein